MGHFRCPFKIGDYKWHGYINNLVYEEANRAYSFIATVFVGTVLEAV